MAIDQALLERAGRLGERWLRLYSWAPHCLSFGRHERAAVRYDRGRIERLGLDTVRRPTGGRAVWHARELTYAVAAPAAELGGLRRAYLTIHRMLLVALRRLGVDAALADAGPVVGLDAGACFSAPVGGEVLVGGRKAIGSAQVRAGGGLLQHGSVLLEDDQSVVQGLMRLGERTCAPVASSPPLGRAVSLSEMANAVCEAAPAVWPGPWHPPQQLDEVLREADAHLPRYRSADWTWRA
jgi:lipoate-protein ligase A